MVIIRFCLYLDPPHAKKLQNTFPICASQRSEQVETRFEFGPGWLAMCRNSNHVSNLDQTRLRIWNQSNSERVSNWDQLGVPSAGTRITIRIWSKQGFESGVRVILNAVRIWCSWANSKRASNLNQSRVSLIQNMFRRLDQSNTIII